MQLATATTGSDVSFFFFWPLFANGQMSNSQLAGNFGYVVRGVPAGTAAWVSGLCSHMKPEWMPPRLATTSGMFALMVVGDKVN